MGKFWLIGVILLLVLLLAGAKLALGEEAIPPKPEAPAGVVADTTSSGEVADDAIPIVLGGLWRGILIGVLANVLGYLKNVPAEKFCWSRLISKAVIGLTAGVATAKYGLSFEAIEGWVATYGLVEVVDKLIKTAWRRVAKKE